ncbi:hypothetical protein AXX17_AT1G31670 [Arabidopsis thaliana]|uniref:F-box domain-containing protein n=2 Tax=Arabidopsis TaxID=3701 RepID=A0A178W7L1_ARATH|nr:hypothetical protein AXX17_AT1G31670 [Arabidopsis thaliana]
MNRGANSDSIPTDLIYEILSRLSVKPITRFRCVSKLWESIICRQDFTELFHNRSSSNPRLLIGVIQGGEWNFFSSPQPQNHYGKSSLVVAADSHMKFSEDKRPRYYSYASGLLYFPNIRISNHNDDVVRVICNPSTGQYAILPPDLRTRYRDSGGFLGFDPIGKQFKVLVFNRRVDDELVYHILTLGTENVRWREIICPFTYGHYGFSWEHICINGVLYYIAKDPNDMMVCFDVRSEKFKLLHLAPSFVRFWSTILINYKNKLGVINLEDDYDGGYLLKLRMFVLEDFEKQKWTTYVHTLRDENKIKDNDNVYVVGATASGQIVLARNKAYKPFYVFYFNPEKSTVQSVEIQGVREEEDWCHRVYYFVDHVEDLRFDVMKTTYAATSIRPAEQNTSTSSREDHLVRTVKRKRA